MQSAGCLNRARSRVLLRRSPRRTNAHQAGLIHQHCRRRMFLFLLQGAAMVGRCSWLALLAMPSTNPLGPRYGDGSEDMTDVKPTRQRTMAAARMRLSRLRRHDGMRLILFRGA